MALEPLERLALPEHRTTPRPLNPAEWSLRDEIFAATQRWYWIVLCGLLGALLGWLAAQLWPSPYRASKELFVGLSVYQAGDDHNGAQHAAIPFTNANDYKNWQMDSLNVIVFMDPVLDETLNRLRQADPYWNTVERDELAGWLHAYWRNAGKWRLVVEHASPVYATQAVLTWQDVVVERVHAAVAEARNMMFYDLQLQTAAEVVTAAEDHVARLTPIQARLDERRAPLRTAPPGQVINEAQRARLLEAVALPDDAAAWPVLRGKFPPPGSTAQDYLVWLAGLESALQAELSASEVRLETHSARYDALAQQYVQATQASLGLSGELIVQKVSDRRLSQTEVRPTGESILIGAGLGFIVWGMLWLARPAIHALRHARDRLP